MNVRELFDYNPETGQLIWKYRPGGPKQWNNRYPGQPAGTKRKDGAMHVFVNGRIYQVHRVIWEHFHGYAPPSEVDHKNGQPWDNRLDNLRLASTGENRRNSRARGDWPKGVYRNVKGKFIAQIKYGGINHYLGSFKTPEEAHEVYKLEAKRVFGEFACWER